MPSAFVVGAGQIGTAIALRLADDGWDVRVGSRGALPTALAGRAQAVRVDRAVPGALAAAIGAGADAVIDTIAYDDADADVLLGCRDAVGQYVVISSAAVYVDDERRSLDRAQGRGYPVMPIPITEAQPTVPPGPDTYATRKRALEERMLGSAVTVTVLRPCAVHGPWSRDPREWWFVKRLLDGRAAIPLAYGGESRFHTAGVGNIAALTVAALAHRRSVVLNAVDPDAPSVAAIGRTIMAALGRTAELVPMPGKPVGTVGGTPWSIPAPILLSDAAARAIGYVPVTDYADGVRAACAWLVEQVPPNDWATVLTGLAK